MKKRPRKKVYIVLHHEIMGTDENPRADEMVFWVASSLQQAIAMIKRSGVCAWSWWEIQEQRIHDFEWPEHVGFYGLRGGKLKQRPYDKCLRLFRQRPEVWRP
jgi:hypothetical protein